MTAAPPLTDGRPADGAAPAGRPPGPRVAPSGPAEVPGEGATTIALTVLTLASAASLFRVFHGHAWTGPVAVTVLAVHLLLWLSRRARVRQPLAVAGGLSLVALTVIWTVFGHTTVYGFPGARTWSQVSAAIHSISGQFSSSVPPVAPTRGFEVLAAAGCGLMAVTAHWLALWRRRPLLGLLPELGIFILGCAAGVGRGRGAVVGVETLAICLFVLTARATDPSRPVWFAGRRAGFPAWVMGVGGTATAAAVVVTLLLSPHLPARDGVGPAGWRSGFGSGGERIVPNPLVSLQSQLITERHVPVFEVTSTSPSYWRLTSLDHFDGTTWTSTGSYRRFGGRLPGVVPAGPAIRTVRATFLIQGLDSVWLPEQFDPVSVQGVKGVSYDPASDSLIASRATSDGLHYSVTSYERLDALSRADLEAAPPVRSGSFPSVDVELPATVDGPVTQLAARITSGLATEYDRALAIQDYLRDPSRFHYTLSPPSDGSGSQALYNFLFVTRQGYCQQFAGAFAVLARAVGLPTRLAVGFTTGRAGRGGTYQVTDGDAHTWPEVYFGHRLGWVPFEPTPQFSIPGTAQYTGASGSSDGPAQATTPTLPASSSATRPSGQKPAPSVPETTTAGRSASPTGSGSSRSALGWWPWPVGLAGLVVVWAGLNSATRRLLRRRRRRRAARAGPAGELLAVWAGVEADLAWYGLRRGQSETDDEFARRAEARLARIGVLDSTRLAHGGLSALAVLGRRAVYSPAVGPEAVAEADAAEAELRRRIRDATSWPQRLRRPLTLRPGAWSRLAAPARAGRGVAR